MLAVSSFASEGEYRPTLLPGIASSHGIMIEKSVAIIAIGRVHLKINDDGLTGTLRRTPVAPSCEL
jgi:hypothetical protein